MTPLSRIFALLFATASAALANAQAVNLNQYVTKDFVAGVTMRPARLLKSNFSTKLIDATGQREIHDQQMQELTTRLGVDPRMAEHVMMLLDRRSVLKMAGLPDEPQGGDQEAPAEADQQAQRNKLKQILLAFHNFHDAFLAFPDDDGHEVKGKDQRKGNLSWRVHLLPFLEEQDLYQEFKFDEPWDSEHNKALIPQMPDVFASNGVKDDGKTCVHVLNSKGTLFGDDKSPRIRDIADGTSYTIMTIVSGADKADIWTKPGGLEVKDGKPKNTLGDIGDMMTFGFADGSARTVSADLDVKTFHALTTRAGGEVTGDIREIGQGMAEASGRLPSWLVRTTDDVDREAVLASLKPMGDPVVVQVKGGSLQTFGDYAVSFPDSRTMVAAPADLLPEMLQQAKMADTRFTKLLSDASDVNDFTFIADLIPVKSLRQKLAGNVPMAGLVQAVEDIQVVFDVAGTSDSLHKITATMQSETSATQVSGLLTGVVQMQRMQVANAQNVPGSPLDAETIQSLMTIFDSAKVEADGVSVSYRIPKPNDMAAFADQILPAMKALQKAGMSARAAARRARRRNRMRRLGLAFHNYHEVYLAFPRHNGNAAGRGGKLSWRVELLPFIEHADLYNRFRRDEPWDSEHNKALISEMPDVFKIDGVDKPGHTSVHVFIGEKTPFGDGSQQTQIRDFHDGTSNTILAVEAGPDTAEIWTKPGGLKFTGDNGRKILGNIGDTFRALFADASVRPIPGTINKDTLHNLIQHRDGNAVDDF